MLILLVCTSNELCSKFIVVTETSWYHIKPPYNFLVPHKASLQLPGTTLSLPPTSWCHVKPPANFLVLQASLQPPVTTSQLPPTEGRHPKMVLKHREIAKSCPEKSHRFWRCQVIFTKTFFFFFFSFVTI